MSNSVIGYVVLTEDGTPLKTGSKWKGSGKLYRYEGTAKSTAKNAYLKYGGTKRREGRWFVWEISMYDVPQVIASYTNGEEEKVDDQSS